MAGATSPKSSKIKSHRRRRELIPLLRRTRPLLRGVQIKSPRRRGKLLHPCAENGTCTKPDGAGGNGYTASRGRTAKSSATGFPPPAAGFRSQATEFPPAPWGFRSPLRRTGLRRRGKTVVSSITRRRRWETVPPPEQDRTTAQRSSNQFPTAPSRIAFTSEQDRAKHTKVGEPTGAGGISS